jgi:hypothetical protein
VGFLSFVSADIKIVMFNYCVALTNSPSKENQMDFYGAAILNNKEIH